MHLKNILMYVQQDATLHSLFYLETALHVSGGTTIHHQERKQLYLQHLVFVRPLLTVWQIPDAVDTVICAPDDGWCYHPKYVEQFPDKINCLTLHLVGHTLEYLLLLFIYNLGTRSHWVVRSAGPLDCRERTLCNYWIGGWGWVPEPVWRLWARMRVSYPYWELKHDSSDAKPIALSPTDDAIPVLFK